MLLDQLSYKISADRYDITEQDLEGLELEQQVELVIDKIQNYIDKQTAAKNEYDEKRNEALAAASYYQEQRSNAKGRADRARSERVVFEKDFKEKIDLINYKANK